MLDQGIKDPPKLPRHLKEHERKASRVDVDVSSALYFYMPVIFFSWQALYADTPIDSSLFSLYIQQNYTQFCNDVDECEGVSDWLSWVDWSGPEEVREVVCRFAYRFPFLLNFLR